MALTRRQIAFVEHYLQCRNATEAARRAGYSLRSARELAHRNMENPEVTAEIAARFVDATQLTTDEVVQRLADQARGSIGTFFKVSERWTDEPLPTEEILEEQITVDADGVEHRNYRTRHVCIDTDKLMDPAYSHLIKKFIDSPKNGLSLELYDAQAALQLVGKTLGVFTEQVKYTGSVEMRQGPDLSVLNDDELAQIEKLLAGAYARTGQGGEGEPTPA